MHGACEINGTKFLEANIATTQLSSIGNSGLQVVPNEPVTMTGSFRADTSPSTAQPPAAGSDAFLQVSGATSAWQSGDLGQGVTVAVLDTGIQAPGQYFAGRVIDGVNLSGYGGPNDWRFDQYGHGTFVAGLIASDPQGPNPGYMGMAPAADLVSIKVAGPSGITSEAQVIAGIEWAIAHEATDNIRVLNLSLGTPPVEPTEFNPLDQAVEQAWQAGIVVVTSAGNAGPMNGTVTSPGDDPLAITVGALDDAQGTNPADYSIPSFSGVGPTLFDGWIKPDLVASGRSVVSLADPGSTIYNNYPSARVGSDYFVGSGTSFSAAITSGAVALLLSQNPSLTPDQVKAALLLSASPGPVGNPLVDGHGILNVPAALQDAGQVTLNQQPAIDAEASAATVASPPTDSFAESWAVSTWNPANWSGAAWNESQFGTAGAGTPATGPFNGLGWTGAAWNGAAWNGAAWNGAAWNGAAWNGAAWNGAAWNGAAWNGAAWNAAAWNGAAWNGAAWNGAAWNASSWG